MGEIIGLMILEDLFPAILREKIKKGEFVFPVDTEDTYEPITGYRCYYRNDGDDTAPGRDDFRSHAELGRVLRGNGRSKPEYYGTSLFTSRGELNNIQSLNKPDKRVAVGCIFQEGGPIKRNKSRGHVCWWLYEDVDLSSFEEVKDDE
ncbi:MAG: hypothetical protein K6B44_05145 [Lachnospiraceae bacterium]|nr:hypothetical protein [Lachnospiraceae bacterium]